MSGLRPLAGRMSALRLLNSHSGCASRHARVTYLHQQPLVRRVFVGNTNEGPTLVLRGIQQNDWPGIAQGITLSLEQTENYERERGGEGTRDAWHDRSKGVAGATAKGIGKWMPEELVKLAERSLRNREK